MSDLEQFVLHPTIVKRAIDYALDGLRPTPGRVEAEGRQRAHELRTVEQEIGNLTRAITAGGDLPSLVKALQQAERQRHNLESAIAVTRQSHTFTAQTAQDLESQVLTKLADWRTTLRQDAPAARQVVRQLISNRITLEAVKQQGRRLYRYSGSFTIGGLFEGFYVHKRWRPRREPIIS